MSPASRSAAVEIVRIVIVTMDSISQTADSPGRVARSPG
jgi:hypothetical protein